MPMVYTDRGDVELTPRESRLYALLASDRARVFTREECLRAIEHPSVPMSSRTVDSIAATLRAKFRAVGIAYGVNVWGVGYRLENRQTNPAAITRGEN